ncbi:MAG: efflux RND transporter permease subunit [Candidatus Synoicihabitans palmerolidicus]|nr:efflux RND transporter permease subunit [Candidatus Synoicihabitans palmerolidicus]
MLKGVRAIIAPVIVGVTTTMAAFAPLLFRTGTLGQIIKVVPAVVIVILSVSLLKAYLILPAHLSTSSRWSRGIMASTRHAANRLLDRFVSGFMIPFARRAIRYRYATLAAFLGIAIFTVGLLKSGTVRFIFFPQIEGDRISISLTMPQGTPFETTEATIKSIEDAVTAVRQTVAEQAGVDAFESVSVSIGTMAAAGGSPRTGTGGRTGSHLGQIQVQLLPSDYRSYDASEIQSMISERVRDLPGIESLEFQSSLIGGGADIEIELSHPREDILNEATDRLRHALESIDGTLNVANSYQTGKTEYVFTLTPEGLAVGLSPSYLGRQLRSAFFGLEVQRIQRGRSEVLVYVRYPKDVREDISTLRNTRIRLLNGSEVPLSAVASITEQVGYSKINPVNGRRIVSVTADADAAVTTPNDIIALLETSILPELGARYPSLSYGFEGETRDQAQDLQSLARNMLVALMIIYIILGAQLRSYLQPFVIMSAIPFGVIGAILGHFLLGYDLTFISMFDVVALMGVVVNDSVVLLDFLNHKRSEGHPPLPAALLAISRRFRPILLTTLSTGIVFATPIILILVPQPGHGPRKTKSLFRRSPAAIET